MEKLEIVSIKTMVTKASVLKRVKFKVAAVAAMKPPKTGGVE